MRTNSLAAVLLLAFLAGAAASCDEIIPKFSNVPEIEFDRVEVLQTPGLRQDTLALTVRFQDGDGDVGVLGSGDTNTWNFFITPYKRFRRAWVPVRFPDADSRNTSTRGIIPVLKPDGRPGPIEGRITYKPQVATLVQRLPFPITEEDSLEYVNGDTLRVEIYIRDQAGNRSNTVESPPFVVLQPR